MGLTHMQFMMLIMAAWVGRTGEPIRQEEIARSGVIHPMQVSLMLKTLEQKGMVTRRSNLSNVRAKVVFVTEVGLTALRRSLPPLIEVQLDLFDEAGRPGGMLLTALLDVESREVRGDGSSGPLRFSWTDLV